jgi:hypothetical protein
VFVNYFLFPKLHRSPDADRSRSVCRTADADHTDVLENFNHEFLRSMRTLLQRCATFPNTMTMDEGLEWRSERGGWDRYHVPGLHNAIPALRRRLFTFLVRH